MGIRAGTIDMHGKPTVHTWAKLATTANNGSWVITLLQSVDWPINSDIVIATSGDRFSQYQSELRRIVNITNDGHTLTLDQPLSYTYFGLVQDQKLTTIEIRSEVGLLSRNIVLQGFDISLLRKSNTIFHLLGSINMVWNNISVTCSNGLLTKLGENVKTRLFQSEFYCLFTGESCYTGPYGEINDLDEFGATIIASKAATNSDDSHSIVIRLSNVEVGSENNVEYELLIFIILAIPCWSKFSSWTSSNKFSCKWKYE